MRETYGRAGGGVVAGLICKPERIFVMTWISKEV